jgi:hypothetical protein
MRMVTLQSLIFVAKRRRVMSSSTGAILGGRRASAIIVLDLAQSAEAQDWIIAAQPNVHIVDVIDAPQAGAAAAEMIRRSSGSAGGAFEGTSRGGGGSVN